jgi:glycosyltransferase involved in cell wall biosynthesis
MSEELMLRDNWQESYRFEKRDAAFACFKHLRVLHVGPGGSCRGGISAVITMLMSGDAPEPLEFKRLASQDDRSNVRKAWCLASALVSAPSLMRWADIVHIHTASRRSFYRKVAFLVLAKLLRRRVVLHIHGGGFGEFLGNSSPSRRWWMLKMLGLADRIVCLTDTKSREISAFLDQERLVSVPNPCRSITPSAAPVTSVRNLLFTGWIESAKGAFDLVRAFAKASEKRPDLRLTLAGRGQIEGVRRLAQELGIADRVLLPGWLTGGSLEQVYREADLFLLPSYCEGLPMSILEAMSYGLPIIATSVGGIPDVIEHGKEGLLVSAGDLAGLQFAIERLADSPDECRTLGANAHRRSKEFSLESIHFRWLDVYRRVVGACDANAPRCKEGAEPCSSI